MGEKGETKLPTVDVLPSPFLTTLLSKGSLSTNSSLNIMPALYQGPSLITPPL